MWRVFRIVCFAVTILIPPVAPAFPQEQTSQADQYREIQRRLAANSQAQSLWNACPADIFKTEKAFWSGLIDNPDYEAGDCEQDAPGCYRHCFEARNENACFALALTLQLNTERALSRHWETMFAVACAMGSAGGCTNRGAGIRNGRYEDDPFSDKSEGVRDACLFRTFEQSCLADDAWGCTMHGMAYQYGEGVKADPEVAKEFYLRSCALVPDFDACDTAHEQIDEIDAQNGASEGK